MSGLPSVSNSQAVAWSGGTVTGLGFLPGGSDSIASAASANGSTIVGAGSDASGHGEAFRWTSAGGMVGLGFLPGLDSSSAIAVSADGATVAGTANPSAGGPTEAFVWTAAGGLVGLGVLPGATSSQAAAISADGSTVVGYCTYADAHQQAFTWTASGGMVGLGFLLGGNVSTATAVSADGSFVVGQTASTSFIWTQADGMRELKEFLITDYGLGGQLSGWQISPTAMSPDHTKIVGTGVNPLGKVVGWKADLATPNFVEINHPEILKAGQSSGFIVVQLRDNVGNPVAAGPGGVALTLSSTSAAGIFLDANPGPLIGSTITIPEGSYQASFRYQDTKGTATLTATGLSFSTTKQVTILGDTFVHSLYADFLGRAGDPAGVVGWANLENAGDFSGVANGIARSTESLMHMVDALYQKILGRASDAAGLNGWVAFLQGGGTLESVTAAFYASAEYALRFNLSNVAFVNQLYADLLGRTADARGLAGWVIALYTGQLTRAQVVAGIINSVEYRNNFVLHLYADLLDRTAAPTADEVAGWVNSGLDLISLQVAFAASLEYRMKA